MADLLLEVIGFAFLAFLALGLVLWLWENRVIIGALALVCVGIVGAFIFANVGPTPAIGSSGLLTIFIVWWILNNSRQRN